MKKIKIGVITEYYNSTNFGGLLQAYALCKVLNEMGFDTEQICFSKSKLISNPWPNRLKNIYKPKYVLNYIYSKIQGCLLRRIFRKKNYYTSLFRNNLIPHSKEVYDESNITNTNSLYDIFIVGSDQVWNPDWYNKGYSLSFVCEGKGKISYAASISKDSLSDKEKNTFAHDLQTYDAISVREKKSVKLLQPLVNKKVEYVLDPTLLLSVDEWNSVSCSNIEYKDYIFCYFLGNNRNARRLVKEFAKNRKMKIITIPFLSGLRIGDFLFGNIKEYNIYPEKFLSLIKNARYVFTDSFHASLFSLLFKKKVVCFHRNSKHEMGSRIISLFDLFESEYRFCNSSKHETIEYVESVINNEYSNPARLNLMLKKSFEYLTNSLTVIK